MARIKKKEMSRQFIYLFLFFQSLCQICHSLETVESHNQAFIQTDKHLTYIMGDVSPGIPIEVKHGQYSAIVGTEDILLSSPIQLDPPMLDFQEQAVGMPRMEQVTVQNTDGKNNLHLLSISGSTLHFHCSFFQDKIVPPGGNTTFDVVFLARQEGNVENTLYIHTSLGSFKYQVFGVGIPNPYRLRPYLGARVPLNTSFAPLINMHNPHSNTLQVLEMFSSEGDLHLELPTGEKEAPRTLWEIPPYETRTIMKAHFVGRTESNHTAFIRIKTSHKKDKELLVLPVEVEVTSSPGLYVTPELIDFGIVRTFDEPRTVPINLVNTGDSAVHISSISVSPPNDAVSVDFRPIKLQPEMLRQTTVAHVTFKASKALHPKLWSGKIIIKSKNNVHKISIPYEARVLHGSLTYFKNMTYFFAHNFLANYTRLMTFTNTFNFSLVLYNVTLKSEVRELFSILNFTKPVILTPQTLVTPFLLKYTPKRIQMHFRTTLTLHTNASTFEIELFVYNGLLTIVPHLPEKFENQLDFGTMGVGEKKSVLFTLVNTNPIEVYVFDYNTDMKGATLEILGIEPGNGTTLTRSHNTSAINSKPLIIQPFHFVVFSLNLVAPDEEASYQAEVYLATNFQETFMPVFVKTSEGSLHAIPEKVVFDKVFPGKIPMKVLQVHSTFHEYMELKSVGFQPNDPRFYFVPDRGDKDNEVINQGRVVLEPETNNTIGRIYFDSKKECKDECYVGLPTYTPAGHQWLIGLNLNREVPETDHYLYTHFRQRWQRLLTQKRDRVNVTLEIDTSAVQGFLFSAHVQHHWPDVIRRCRPMIKFPLTQIGNVSTVDVMIENPGDLPVIVQILPLHLYPNHQTVIDLFRHELPPYFTEYMETDDNDIFVLSELNSNKSDSSMNKFRKYVDETMGVKSHKGTITQFLNKQVKIKVQVGFKPKDDTLRTSLIIVRNNLTIIDAMVLEGQGGRGEIKLNNKKPGISALQFDIAERHLKNCDKRKHTKNTVPNLTVKRSFTLKNTGKLPFYVHGYNINNSPCEGYGFRVLDCEGYEMQPNTSRKIDIAFTPDFTMSRIQRVLTIYTSLGSEFNYTLQATVPPHTLSKCSASLPRPNWEPVLYYTVVGFWGFILLGILFASYFEADRIFVADILKRKVKSSNGAPPYNKDKIFDLKAISASSNGNNNSISSVPKPSIPPNLMHKLPPSMTRPLSELTPNHAETRSRQPSFFSSFIGFLKSTFAQKPKSSRKKVDNNNIENASPGLKPGNTPTPAVDSNASKVSTVASIDKEKPIPTPEIIIPEKSSTLQQRINLRKPKAAKRSHQDMNLNGEPAAGIVVNGNTTGQVTSHMTIPTEKKQSNKSSSSVERRESDVTNTVKDKTPTPTMTDTAGLSTFSEVKPVYDAGKQKGKKKLRSKPERDNLVKDRLNLRQTTDDKDETSSTSAESSVGDTEEKSVQEEMPEPVLPSKPSKTKKKARNLEPLIISQEEDEFELTSKSRAYKKIKGQKDMYDGDFVKASALNLELPYNIEPKRPKKKKSPIPEKAEKVIQEKQKGALSDLDHDDTAMETHTESDSPAPSWDEPHSITPSEDLAELALQTDQFAQKHSRPVEGSAHFSPDGLTSSSRSSSYSSIVSSSSSGEGTNGKNKADKQKHPLAPFNPFGETIPTLTPPVVTAPNKLRNAWANPASVSPGIAEPPIGFGLQTIQESTRPGPILTDTKADMFKSTAFDFDMTGSASPTMTTSEPPGYGFSNQYSHSSMTMMQRLQRERRQRIREHQQRRNQGEDWPGFDMPLTTSESLWDSEYSPLDRNPYTWNMNPDSPHADTANGLWSTLTNSANSGWNSLMGIWGSNQPATAPMTDPLAGSPLGHVDPLGPPRSGVGSPVSEGLPSFGFSSDIWSPSASVTNTFWGMPPPGVNGSSHDNKDN